MKFIINLLTIAIGFGAMGWNEGPCQQAQQSDTLKIWNVRADRIAADPLGHYYIIHAGSVVRYNSQGDSLYSWSEPQSGRITMADAGDPMRILVYQKDFNLLRFLNNRLAPLSGPVRLDDHSLTAPLAMAISRQGGFWVLDGASFRIRNIDQQMKPRVESQPLNIPSGSDATGYRMTESGDRVLLLIPGKEIQVFDLFASLISKIPVRAISFNAYGNLILLVSPDKVTLWKDAVTEEEILFTSTGSDIREACLFQNNLLIRTDEKVMLINVKK